MATAETPKTRYTIRLVSQSVVLALWALLAALPINAVAITIPTVPVGNLGNTNDPLTGKGGVDYAYNIGMTEVTVGQYTAFLNAVAANDTYSLYNTSMATFLNIAGIARSGVLGSYNYSVIGSANHPVTFVSWGDAARFSNWLHNSQPTGAQGPGTTETGAYTINGAITPPALHAVSRNSGATWFIPSESEWYKAAYYQPAAQGGDSDSYWLYPMRTNSVPYSDQPPGATPNNTRVGNFFANDGLTNGYNDGYAVTGTTSYSSNQNYLTDAGAYASSSTFYGTFDQGGNVSEWNETRLEILAGPTRSARGGSWDFTVSDLQSSQGFQDYETVEYPDLGFRVANLVVPEPSTAVLAIISGGMMWMLRKRLK